MTDEVELHLVTHAFDIKVRGVVGVWGGGFKGSGGGAQGG